METGVFLLGVVLTSRFSRRLEEMLSDSVRTALPPGRLDAIENNPRVLFDPSTIDALKADFASAGGDGARMTEMLLDSLNSALAGAVSNALTVGALAISLSVVAVLFLSTQDGSADTAERE